MEQNNTDNTARSLESQRGELMEASSNRAKRLRELAAEYAARTDAGISSLDLKKEINAKSELFESLRSDLEELQDKYHRLTREEEARKQRELELEQRIKERPVRFVNEKTGESRTLKGQYSRDELPEDGLEFSHMLNQHTIGQTAGWLEENEVMTPMERGIVKMARKHLKEYAQAFRSLRDFLNEKPVARTLADLKKLEHHVQQVKSSVGIIRRAGVEFHPIAPLEEFFFDDVQLPLQPQRKGEKKGEE